MTLQTCYECGRPIERQEPYETADRHSPSGPGLTLYRHLRCPSEPTTGPSADRRGEAA
ncbi:hypothetical protein [Streptomyces uncialis]|uniref:hypothetical protein n=1 Tax=Streptomyces uncialis TaxID=1048205 RepID=UPI00224D09DF|nr:hypothetical protein [Streptomyces uncialis]MCX4661520.1 hypothetical protein [Streptomyces uncialis]